MLKAVLFDLDETLIDWSDFSTTWEDLVARHVNGVHAYIQQHHPFDAIEAYTAEFRNRTLAAWNDSRGNMRAPHLGRVLLESAAALGVPSAILDERRFLEAYAWQMVQGTRLFPDVRATLTLLRAAGLRFGIITNAYQPMWMRDAELDGLGLSEFFPECRFSAADVGYLKPHPSIFQTALDCLGVKADEAVFVGDDLEADIQGACGAGIFCVLRYRGETAPTLDGIVPNASLNSLEALPSILDEHFAGWR